MYPSALLPAGGTTHVHVGIARGTVLDPAQPWLDTDEWFSRHPDSHRSAADPPPARHQRPPPALAHRVRRSGRPARRARSALPRRRRRCPAQSGITSFEQWVQCGAAYFVTRVLGARADDTDPTDIVDIEPREKGTLVHRLFERFIGEWIEAHPEFDGPWIARPRPAADHAARRGRARRRGRRWLARHRLGHPQMWRARRAQILAAVRRELQAEIDDGATPLATEFGFGRARRHRWCGSRPRLPVEVHFTGSIDRLTACPTARCE